MNTKDLWKNEHFKSALYALAFVTFMLASLYLLSETFFFDYFYEISFTTIGLFALIFPKFTHKIWSSLDLDKKPYTKKEKRISRIFGLIMILIPIVFYFLDKYVR